MSEIIFNGLSIEHICKNTLKNSYISVSRESKIVLKTPRVSQSFISKLLLEKESWIRKQLLKIEQNPPVILNLEDEILLFGEVYSIDMDEAKYLSELLQRVKTQSKVSILKCYDNFYKHSAKQYLPKRVEYFADIMELNYKEIKFRKMRSRWGSCSSDGVITFNSELMKIQKDMIDYVVVHELAHLVYMNHSKIFHDLVNRYILNSKEIRKKLKKTNLFNHKEIQ